MSRYVIAILLGGTLGSILGAATRFLLDYPQGTSQFIAGLTSGFVVYIFLMLTDRDA